MVSELKDISDINIDGFIHGRNLNSKHESTGDDDLREACINYSSYRKVIDSLTINDKNSIKAFVEATNEYREKVLYLLENRPNSGQENLRSTILEEFFRHLFKDLVSQHIEDASGLVQGRANSYVSLSFAPYSFSNLFKTPNAYVHTKDQDFVLGCSIKLSAKPAKPMGGDNEIEESEIVIPVLAIECKTYIERNMLDSCAATARRLKSGMPYCLYIVAAEYMKMAQAYPELTDIDEVFIFCKAKNSERLEHRRNNIPPHPIDYQLVLDLYEMVSKHLNRIWWAPKEALERGRVICRP